MPDAGSGHPRGPGPALTPRQAETLSLLALGLSFKDIASRMGVSYNTVRNHCREIYLRMGVQSRFEAVAHLPTLDRVVLDRAEAALEQALSDIRHARGTPNDTRRARSPHHHQERR